MTHTLSTRRRLVTPPELPESPCTGARRSSTGPAWPLGLASRQAAATPTDLALVRARNESAVDEVLATLPDHWAAFASPALGGDGASAVRLLVGPGGVFALYTQLYDGRIVWVHRHTLFVVGQRSPNLVLAESGARRLTLLLRGRLPLRSAVQPALVVLGARALWVTGRSASGKMASGSTASGQTGAGRATQRQTPPVPVPVLSAATLSQWLAARPQVLRPIERMELAAVIDNPVTWGIRPSIVPRSDTGDSR
ncbi:hypothetical protein [Cryobacterium ruanii]|uniref:NERD domain-containing protein n=1 Tax=Cryobacterium ruanii TaxID=1259197 RepID=A0A4R9AP71_9MICO|nr:hypothetical protein [Cryobacterium ruanii]TFD65681.1 hypothetical protein E3T47_09055 [Cryobacterium ruanii]